MSQKKKKIRRDFREAVFARDKHKCTMCGKGPSELSVALYTTFMDACEDTLDAHHVTPREEMPNGGYVKENGITLCKKKCHLMAEEYLSGTELHEGFPQGNFTRKSVLTKKERKEPAKDLLDSHTYAQKHRLIIWKSQLQY